MKIAISGSQCVGKTTFINDFIKNWPMYTTPTETYRDIIKKNKLGHSSNGSEDTQTAILEFQMEQNKSYRKGHDKVIFDRCELDNLAYTSWLHLNGKASERFLDETRIKTRRSLEGYDLIFFLPLTKVSQVEIKEDGMRDTDPVFREEVDNIFKVFMQSYYQGDGRVFPSSDGPAVIEIYGNPEERIKLTSLYITQDGEPYGEDQSLLVTA